MELISVIVPVFNVEKYLEKCVESILEQSYTNLEILLIDDGSNDSSGIICDGFLERDNRIRVFHQNNRGLSGARNTGISLSKGSYVSFIDSDDYISKDYILNLWHMLKTYDADVAMCLAQKFFDGEDPTSDIFDEKLCEVYDSCAALESMLYRRKINSYAWGKLYKRELFDNVEFPEGVLFEDMRTLYKIYDLCKRIVFNPARSYFYYQRDNSIVNSVFSKKKLEQILASEDIIKFVDERYPMIHDAAVSKCFVAAVDIYRRIPSSVEFYNEKKYAETIIKKYRIDILKDKKNKKITKVIGFVACINVRLLDVAGHVYQWLISTRILKMKNPI